MAAIADGSILAHDTRRDVVIGVLNVTPDSFSDAGEFLDPASARHHARRLVDDGADAIDVGAESTRPGAARISAGEQIARLREVLPAVCATGLPVSIDTTRAAVAEAALDAGATIVNDVSAGRDDPDLLPLAARREAVVVLMHMLGEPNTMQRNPHYDDVVVEVRDFLYERMAAAEAAGVPLDRIVVDPGIGFGKRLEHNLALLKRIDVLAALGAPVLVGPSRKSFIGELSGESQPTDRVAGTLAACLEARRGGARLFRVHDVKALRQALTVTAAIETARQTQTSAS
ncbi:MAG: dihydropteroate synthase [Phycisphaerae bacterium]|nr:dihydropteroate synthase [Phycisphaerae bacterium]